MSRNPANYHKTEYQTEHVFEKHTPMLKATKRVNNKGYVSQELRQESMYKLRLKILPIKVEKGKYSQK